MPKTLPIFYSAMLLTGVNLVLRIVGTSFQVYLSGRIGAAGVGLLQLIMSVGGLAMVAGIAGVRTASMYLTAEELGRGNKQNVTWVLSGCFYFHECDLAIRDKYQTVRHPGETRTHELQCQTADTLYFHQK